MSANVVVPEVGESIVDARVAKWLKKEGDAVTAGEPLVELETDKIDLEVSAPQAGVLKSIAHRDGADVKVGEVLGVIDESTSAPKGATVDKSTSAATGATVDKSAPPAPAPDAQADKKRATPAARNAAQQNAVDLKLVSGSGDAGRVMKRDVESTFAARAAGAATADKSATPAPKPSGPARDERRIVAGDRTEERVRMSKRRATIARRLVEAQSTAAMLTRVNAEIQGDEMVLKHYYDIGIAVGASEGLVVPVLRDADAMSFAQIEGRVRQFAKAAEDGTLSLADLKGGTFTITNGGVFGSLMSTPILHPPQVAILGLHAIKDRPMAINGQVQIRPMMYMALTYDHRIVDGAEAVQFLVRVKQLVEDPGALLLE